MDRDQSLKVNQQRLFSRVLPMTHFTTGYKLKMTSLVLVLACLISSPVQWLYGSHIVSPYQDHLRSEPRSACVDKHSSQSGYKFIHFYQGTDRHCSNS
jgi:hypothetical protein